jgi:hypothetical protein
MEEVAEADDSDRLSREIHGQACAGASEGADDRIQFPAAALQIRAGDRETAALPAAAATNRIWFGLSQNLCEVSILGGGVAMRGRTALADGMGALGSGPCAHSLELKARVVIDTNALTRSMEKQLIFISAVLGDEHSGKAQSAYHELKIRTAGRCTG